MRLVLGICFQWILGAPRCVIAIRLATLALRAGQVNLQVSFFRVRRVTGCITIRDASAFRVVDGKHLENSFVVAIGLAGVRRFR